MSGARWVTTLSWLSGSLRPFLFCSSMYSCYLFLISSASVRFLPFLSFLSFIVPIFAWNGPVVSPILLKRSLVFPILLSIHTDKVLLTPKFTVFYSYITGFNKSCVISDPFSWIFCFSRTEFIDHLSVYPHCQAKWIAYRRSSTHCLVELCSSIMILQLFSLLFGSNV